MAGPVRKEVTIVTTAVSAGNLPPHTMAQDRISQEILIDDERVALDDLSHQRSLKSDNANVAAAALEGALQQNAQKKAGIPRRVISHSRTTETLAMGRVYRRMGELWVVPRYILYIVPLGTLIAVPIVVGAILPQVQLGVLFTNHGCEN